MNKQLIYSVTAGVLGALILGIIGLLIFINYGGNNCDQPPAMTCDCFCCHMFNSRGYESCGVFGLLIGIIIGGILGVLSIRPFLDLKIKKKK